MVFVSYRLMVLGLRILIEYAEYTSAQERIALGKKSRKVETSKRRDEMKDLIADA